MFHIFNFILLMINPTVLETKLAGLVGYRQPFNPEYQILDSTNTASRSGYFMNDNSFVKIESIKDSQDYADITDIEFNNLLRRKVSTAIVNVANAVFNENDFIDRQLIYKNALNKFKAGGTYTYDLTPGFICYWLRVESEKNIAFKIKRVLLEFDGTGDITLHLFNTANLKTPLQSKTVTINSPFQEVDLDWVCDNSAGKGYKGDYYLGYFSDGMTIKPFKREYRDATVMSEISDMFIQRCQFSNFTTLAADFELQNLSPYQPYNGINPDITVYEDFTDLIVQNEKLFARAIQLSCQIDLLSETVSSLRSNRNERISAQYIAQLMTQIEGETGDSNVKVKGLRPQFYGALATLRKEIKKLAVGYESQGEIMVQTIC